MTRNKEVVKVHKHVVLPVDTYEQFEGKRSHRFSRLGAKMFLDHPERLEQYNVWREYRFSRFIAIDIVTKIYSEKGNNNAGQKELPSKETHPLDVTSKSWQKFMKKYKALFTKMYDIRIHERFPIYRLSIAFSKRWTMHTRATKGKSVFDRIEAI